MVKDNYKHANIMVALVELLTNLPIFKKPSLQYMNLHTTLWPKLCLKVRGLS